MSKSRSKRSRRSFTEEYRRNAVSMVEEQGYATAAAARELGIHENLLRAWRKKYGRAAEESSGLSESEQDELSRLRKENQRLRMERDILKKATAFFANDKN